MLIKALTAAVALVQWVVLCLCVACEDSLRPFLCCCLPASSACVSTVQDTARVEGGKTFMTCGAFRCFALHCMSLYLPRTCGLAVLKWSMLQAVVYCNG